MVKTLASSILRMIVVVIGCLSGRLRAAPVAITESMTYTQSFDDLGIASRPWVDDSTIPAWWAQINNGLTLSGNLQASDGTNGSLNGLLNLGQPGGTDRALGSKATSSGNMANIAFGLQFRNMSGQRVMLTRLAYTGELWRTNSSTGGLAERFFLSHALSATKITNLQSGPSSPDPIYGVDFYWYGDEDDWTSPNNSPPASALDGNAAANRASVVFTPPNLVVEPGEYLMIKWTDTNPSGTDGHQGLEDVSVSFRTLDAPGDLETGFLPTANRAVYGMAGQPDGKILISGQFGLVNSFARPYAARLLPNGTLDPDFTPAIVYNNLSGYVGSLIVQADGDVLLGGGFTTPELSSRKALLWVDAGGNYEAALPMEFGSASVIAPAPDGNVVVGGSFALIDGLPRTSLAGIGSGRTLIPQFAPVLGHEQSSQVRVNTAVAQPNGRILIGGAFITVDDIPRNLVARLHADGSLDESFDAHVESAAYSGSSIDCLALQPDGKVIAYGRVEPLGDTDPRPYLVRFHPDGSRDTGFVLNSGVPQTNSLQLQADGKIICVGARTQRLHPDGSRDLSFMETGNYSGVYGGMLQADGRVVLHGDFTELGPNRMLKGLARLLNDPAPQILSVMGVTRVQWLRGGSSPETHFVTFELSTDSGQTWTSLGTGSRVSGGWQRTGLSLPAAGRLRARARTACGGRNASAGWVEAVAYYTLTPLQSWRYQHFGDSEAFAMACDNADPDSDGLVNLVEFGFGLDPNTADAQALPGWQKAGGAYVMEFSQPAGVSGVSYVAEASSSLQSGSWTTIPNESAGPHYRFTTPAAATPRLFLRVRVRVTSP